MKKENIKAAWLYGLSALMIVVLAYGYVITRSIIATNENDYLAFSSVEVLPMDIGIDELSTHESSWSPVDLPFHWRSQFSDKRAVWYRFSVSESELSLATQSSEDANEPSLGVYIWRLNQTADIWFNGSKIGSGGNTTEPMARHWNSPLYFPVPSGLWQEQNQILIKHFSQHNWGSIEPIILGREDYLRPVFERRYFIQHDIALGLFVFVFSTAVFSIAVWLYRRRDVQYLWFAIAAAGISFYCLNQFIRYLPFNADAWRWLLNVAIDVWACCTFIYIIRSLGLSKPGLEKLAYGYLLSGLPLYFYASYYQVFDINIYFHSGSLVLGLYGIYITGKEAIASRESLPAFYCMVITLLFVAGFHDVVMQGVLNNGWWNLAHTSFQFRHNLAHVVAPSAFLILAAGMIKRFIDSMSEADKLNQQLELRIKDAREELTESHIFMEELAVAKSTHEERERIYRDLHDDVGAKLLSLYYRLDDEADSSLAKSALDDLRDIVSHKAPGGGSLNSAVEEWRSEVLERVQDAGIPLSWNFDNPDTDIQLNELQLTHLRRMLREGISNVICHAVSATTIVVDINVDEDYCLTMSISNDGAERPTKEWKSGRGIGNLRVRSHDLQGEFSLKDIDHGWVQVCWSVPLDSNIGEQS